MTIQTLRRGALSACLLLSLTSCANSPVAVRTITVHTPVIVPVPTVYTQPVPVPELSNDNGTVCTLFLTNADLAHYILILRQALADANAKLQMIAGLTQGAPKQ